jgi:hypothetical protein
MIWAATLLALLAPAAALTTPQLRERSIYQVTDRFERPDGAVAPCDPAERRYCGGGWKGIERQLPYIQGMGFDTGEHVRCRWLTQCGSAPWSPTSTVSPARRATTVCCVYVRADARLLGL